MSGPKSALRAISRIWLLFALLSAVCLPFGCASPNPLPPSGNEWVELASRRLKRAVEAAARAGNASNAAAHANALAARTEALQKLRDRLAASLAKGNLKESEAEQTRAMIAAADKRLRELTAAAEAHALRGSIKSFPLKAELAWETELVKELAERAGLPAEVVPANLFQLLPKEALERLRESSEASVLDLRKAAASAPPGTYKRAIEEAEAKLQQIKEALEAPGVDLEARFFHGDKRPAIDPDLATWLREREAKRAEEIRERTRSLLLIENARDGSDVAVLLELRKYSPVDPSQAITSRRALAMTRARSSRSRGMDCARTMARVRRKAGRPCRNICVRPASAASASVCRPIPPG